MVRRVQPMQIGGAVRPAAFDDARGDFGYRCVNAHMDNPCNKNVTLLRTRGPKENLETFEFKKFVTILTIHLPLIAGRAGTNKNFPIKTHKNNDNEIVVKLQ